MEISLQELVGMNITERDNFISMLLKQIGNEFEYMSWKELLPIFLHKQSQMEFLLIPSANYEMGLSEAEEASARALCDPPPLNIWEMRPVHQTIVSSLLISRLPVLNNVGGRFFKELPNIDKANNPAYVLRVEAEYVASKFNCRLPYESEWEFCCRAGTKTLFFWGNDIPEDDELERLLAYNFSDLGSARPNPFGLYGLFVSEWCLDEFRTSYEPDASVETDSYVVRGGGAIFWPWQDEEWVWCMSAMRMPSKDLSEDRRAHCRLVYDLASVTL